MRAPKICKILRPSPRGAVMDLGGECTKQGAELHREFHTFIDCTHIYRGLGMLS